jgi:hypothetical protein
LEASFSEGTWPESLRPPESILSGWPIYGSNPDEERAILQGRAVALEERGHTQGGMAAVKGAGGDLLAIVEWNEATGLWQPKKVLGA